MSGTSDRRGDSRRGFTMMELVVAIAMAAMVLLAIGMSSRWIVGHVISRRQAARLDAETQRIADAVVGQLRRAREIRQWDRTSIEFVSGVTGDTVVYRFAGDRLVRNGTVMRPRVPDGEISGFRLSRDSPEVLVETPEILLRISLSCADRRGNTSNVTASATVAAPPEGVEPATDGWNF